MITKTAGYQSSDGTIHGSLELAQRAELRSLFTYEENSSGVPWTDEQVVTHIFDNRDKLIDILTMTPKSKPRARKINGGTKARAKKSTRHEAEQFPMPFEDNNKPAA